MFYLGTQAKNKQNSELSNPTTQAEKKGQTEQRKTNKTWNDFSEASITITATSLVLGHQKWSLTKS